MTTVEAESAVGRIDRREADYSRGYARYVLIVLVLVYVLNFVDRQILSILAEDIKADLGLTDADLGFLYGTVFAVFYAVFGIPLSRLADMWVRKNLIAIGLALWSAMTALSGTARGFGSLAAYRIGVGVGESSASPAAFSLLCDYFSPRVRATVMAIYSSGVYIGIGLGILLGGVVVDGWNSAFPDRSGPFGIAGWQAAFFVVGIPGLLLAVLVASLREPVRGQAEGLVTRSQKRDVWREFGIELAAVVPPLTLVTLYRTGAGAHAVLKNVGAATLLVAGAWTLMVWIGSPTQWVALGMGLYAFFSWVQVLAHRDPVTFAMIYRSPAIVLGMIGFGWHAFTGYAVIFWIAPYLLRTFEVSVSEVGLFVGLTAAAGGWAGATLGGIISDRLKRRVPQARLYMGIAAASLSAVPKIGIFLTDSLPVAYVLMGAGFFINSCWIGSAVALSNELVLPRMRATSGVFYILVVTFIGRARACGTRC